MAEQFTVFGASGFIGSRIVVHLRTNGFLVREVNRYNWPSPGEELGHVIYAIGMTADFRTKPFETVDAHVVLVSRVLDAGGYDSFLLLSSTRVYRGAATTSECAQLNVDPSNPDHLYNITKLCGESLCLTLDRPTVRVARLSNVFGGNDGSQNFLNSVIHDAKFHRNVILHQSLASSKDYIHIDDVCAGLLPIVLNGRHRMYNVASGINTDHREILSILENRFGASFSVSPHAVDVIDNVIDVTRISGEINWSPHHLKDYLSTYVLK